MPADNESNNPWPGYRTYPERLNLAREVLTLSMERGLGSRPALVSDDGPTTYEALERQIDAVAAGLIQLGLKRSDLALIKMSNSTEFAVAFLAAVKLGIIPVLVNSQLSAGELGRVVEQVQPQLVFTE